MDVTGPATAELILRATRRRRRHADPYRHRGPSRRDVLLAAGFVALCTAAACAGLGVALFLSGSWL